MCALAANVEHLKPMAHSAALASFIQNVSNGQKTQHLLGLRLASVTHKNIVYVAAHALYVRLATRCISQQHTNYSNAAYRNVSAKHANVVALAAAPVCCATYVTRSLVERCVLARQKIIHIIRLVAKPMIALWRMAHKFYLLIEPHTLLSEATSNVFAAAG